MNIQEFNQISKKLVGENIDSILEKAYCTILFTSTYVIKLFCRNKREYDAKALHHEYLWDKNMPYLSARFIENVTLNDLDISVLILKRIPNSANMLYKLSRSEISNNEICIIGNLVKKIIFNFPKIGSNPNEVYKNYIANLNLQIENLTEKLKLESMYSLLKARDCHKIFDVFEKAAKNSTATLVHGNLFSGNIFYYKSELIIIDPISYNHIARMSFPHMDLATFLVDIRIFKNAKDYGDVYKQITINMEKYELLLIQLYFVLKLLVRLRFAYMENNLHNNLYNQNVNKIIIENGNEIIERETRNLINALNEFSD